MSHQSYSAPQASGPLDARLSLPGSKSLTNRELVLSALADHPSRLRAPLRSRDTDLMAAAIRALGAGVEEAEASGSFGPDWVVSPIGSSPVEESRSRPRRAITIDVGLAGTVMRFVPTLAALVDADVTFDGDEGARRRPMATTIRALRDLGVEVTGEGLPFTVHGTGRVAGGELAIDASASSQFVSGLLLAAPRFEDGLVLRHTGDHLPSLPHIEMTISRLAARGAVVQSPTPGLWVVPSKTIHALDEWIEPDLSNAAPFLAAPLITGGRVTIDGWPHLTTQVGDELEWLLQKFGALVTRADGRLTVDGGAGLLGGSAPNAVTLDLSGAGELAPTLVALAALAATPSTFTGIGHLRGHETDRLAALGADIGALGGRVTELDDGLLVEPAPLRGGDWAAFADHRMATAGALIGLAVPGVLIDDIGTTAKTLPEFRELWERMLGMNP